LDNSIHSKLKKLIELYARTKHLMIKAEEFDLAVSNTYLQPRLELFQAFDHLISDYLVKNINGEEGDLESAIKHVVTAFFDIADWTMIIIWERVREELRKYSPETITTAIPSYYSEIRPELEQLKEKITCIRANKVQETLEDTDRYVELIERAYDHAKTILRAKGTMLELQSKRRFMTWIGPVIGFLGIVVAIITIFIK